MMSLNILKVQGIWRTPSMGCIQNLPPPCPPPPTPQVPEDEIAAFYKLLDQVEDNARDFIDLTEAVWTSLPAAASDYVVEQQAQEFEALRKRERSVDEFTRNCGDSLLRLLDCPGPLAIPPPLPPDPSGATVPAVTEPRTDKTVAPSDTPQAAAPVNSETKWYDRMKVKSRRAW